MLNLLKLVQENYMTVNFHVYPFFQMFGFQFDYASSLILMVHFDWRRKFFNRKMGSLGLIQPSDAAQTAGQLMFKHAEASHLMSQALGSLHNIFVQNARTKYCLDIYVCLSGKCI